MELKYDFKLRKAIDKNVRQRMLEVITIEEKLDRARERLIRYFRNNNIAITLQQVPEVLLLHERSESGAQLTEAQYLERVRKIGTPTPKRKKVLRPWGPSTIKTAMIRRVSLIFKRIIEARPHDRARWIYTRDRVIAELQKFLRIKGWPATIPRDVLEYIDGYEHHFPR